MTLTEPHMMKGPWAGPAPAGARSTHLSALSVPMYSLLLINLSNTGPEPDVARYLDALARSRLAKPPPGTRRLRTASAILRPCSRSPVCHGISQLGFSRMVAGMEDRGTSPGLCTLLAVLLADEVCCWWSSASCADGTSAIGDAGSE
eukprot:CAMPEP_0202869928 /NCGR_PEP_ID=MMETSP1391-20130828/13834_1 /ASSEMBLY_ACC=CAM_ASM_000867 /TAXON_ID=1034604 /ORGANISM="Chlamydomonas leiostraca, Strain SAG 11-49" /LENGTH=146 /DNA_ID=CAMNT_0049550333 /DNA_START=222 /DNA_END=662 /DNA_ORIENTATION=+